MENETNSDLQIIITKQLHQLQAMMQRIAFRTVPERSSYRGQGRVLDVLMQNPEITRKELGEKIDCSRQALSELLNKMEKSGYIIRQPDPRDRRICLICLTQKGRTAAKENNDGLMEISQLLECLSEEELHEFNHCLESILGHDRELFSDSCSKCTGPENCTHDYLKYGHDKPNPRFCKYARFFKDDIAD